MNRLWLVVLLGVFATAVAQQPVTQSLPNTKIMIAAVSRDSSIMVGGFPPSKLDDKSTVDWNLLGHLTPSGQWSSGLPCSDDPGKSPAARKGCIEWAHAYQSKPHVYTVISADGYGTVVHVTHAFLSDCYGFGGTGAYSDDAIRKFAIATSSARFFAESAPPHPLSQEESVAVQKALMSLVPKKLGTTHELRLFGVRLEGHKFIVIQRTFSDVGNQQMDNNTLIFAIGTLNRGQFHLLHWKQNTVDEQETMLGTIALKSGREFLITAVTDPEGNWYRVYGFRHGRLTLIYTGGGGSC
jgi:hypothetical protein